MTKNIIKEIIIFLLLCLAIILIFGILFYEYVPISKTVPNQVSYVAPESVRQELADSASVDDSQIIRTYEVDATDLNNYKKIQNYKPGKANPFSSYEPEVETTTNSTNATNTTNTASGTTSTNTTQNNSGTTNSGENGRTQSGSENNNTTTSGGTFFRDKGTK